MSKELVSRNTKSVTVSVQCKQCNLNNCCSFVGNYRMATGSYNVIRFPTTRAFVGAFFFLLLLGFFLVTNIKCKAGGRVRLMNELRHQEKKTRQKTRSRCSHSSLSQSWYKSSLNLSHYAFLHYWGHLAIALLFFKKRKIVWLQQTVNIYIHSKYGR